MNSSRTADRQIDTAEMGAAKQPASIVDVAEYILRISPHGISTMKLMKLLYLAQGWHLAIVGTPLFAEQFEAWPSGPVNREIYDLTKGEFTIHAGFIYQQLRATAELMDSANATHREMSSTPDHQRHEQSTSDDDGVAHVASEIGARR